MRGNLPAYEMKIPASLDEAFEFLDAGGEWKPFAGGTDLMVLFEAGKLAQKKFVNLWGLSELEGIEEKTDAIEIGALTTYSMIRAKDTLQKEFPMLCAAARETGAIAIQNRGTIGGNIANASPAADSPPALLVYGAKLELASSAGRRTVDYGAFHLDYKKTLLRPGEIVAKVILPRSKSNAIHHYRKVGTRKAQAISKVCVAAMARMDRDTVVEIRVAFGSIAPTAIRCVKIEAFLKGKTLDAKLIAQAKAEVAREIAPIDDIRSTAVYRKTVAANLLEEFLEKCGTGQAN